MKGKISKKVVTITLSCLMISNSFMGIHAAANPLTGLSFQQAKPKNIQDMRVNYARMHGVKASATSEEELPDGTTRSASMAIDGIVDNEHRWASKNNTDVMPLPKESLTIDLQKEQPVEEITLHWQRPNIKHFTVEVKSENGNYEQIYEGKDRLTNDNLVTTIDLPEIKTLRYIRVSSDDYDGATAAAPSGGYTAVSLLEVGVYNKKYSEGMVEISDTASALNYVIKNSTIGGMIPRNQGELTFTGVPGYRVEVTADYEQLIDKEGKIHHPLTNQKVKYLYKVSDDYGKSESQEYTVELQGEYENFGVNAKPRVIPELSQWYGTQGDFAITSDTRIVYADTTYESAMKEFQQDVKDLFGKQLPLIQASAANAGDFFFTKDDTVAYLGKEGYEMSIDDQMHVKASNETGAYYATRSILQIMEQTNMTLPKGFVRDYPKYQLRGFMLDIARKPTKFETVKQLSKALSWYKLNDFQIHLSDNYAKMEKHLKDPNTDDRNQIESIMDEVYSAFRLESNEEGLTSKDVSYTKKEFRQLIDDSKNIGVNIVPEFDVPGHSLAFLKNHKDLYYQGAIQPDPWGTVAPSADRIAMFDVTNPDAVNYIKDLFSEYIDDGTFSDSVVHVGGDEFYGDKASYRTYMNDLLTWMKQDKNRTPRIWGSLSAKNGTQPVLSKGVQMNIWNTDWAKPMDMLKAGYDIINTNDTELYIVPGANWYHDYLDNQYIYTTFEPNRFCQGAKDYIPVATIPAGNEQMIGSSFALWNDSIDVASNGINEYEINNRILRALPAVSAKMWGDGGDGLDLSYDEFDALSKQVAQIPETNLLNDIQSKTDKIVDYDFDKASLQDTSGNGYHGGDTHNVQLSNDYLTLQKGASWLDTGLSDLGPTNHLQISVKRSEESDDSEQILMESEQSAVKAVQTKTGKVGYSREGYDYSFNYTLPKGVWVKLDITCDAQAVKLFVNGELTDTLPILQTITTGKDPYKTTRSAHDTSPDRYLDYPTLVLPLARIGSKTKAFIGTVDNVKVYNKVVSDIDYQQLLARIEKLSEAAYSPESWAALQAVVKDNEIIMSDTTTQNDIDIAVIHIQKALDALVKVEVPVDKSELQALIETASKLNELEYTATSWKDFANALNNAKNVNTNDSATKAEIEQAMADLNKAIKSLVKTEPSQQTDKTALKKLLEQANALQSKDYTASTWKNFASALKHANQVYEDAQTDQNAVDKAKGMLETAMKNLVKAEPTQQTDKTALKKLLEQAKALQSQDYTASTWKNFASALKHANQVYKDAQTDQNAVDKAKGMLETAMKNLVKAELTQQTDKTALKKLLEQAKALQSKDYTASTWKNFASALKHANQVYKDAQTDQNAVDKAKGMLETAMKELVKHSTQALPESKPADKNSPDTGDMTRQGILYFGLAMSSLTGIFVWRKKYDKKKI